MNGFEIFILILEILGIAVGVAIILLIIWSLVSLSVFIYLLLKRRKRRKEEKTIPAEEEEISLKAIFRRIIPKKKH